jgi:hypothetical protein
MLKVFIGILIKQPGINVNRICRTRNHYGFKTHEKADFFAAKVSSGRLVASMCERGGQGGRNKDHHCREKCDRYNGPERNSSC